jgi:NAD-dependent deacetylase
MPSDPIAIVARRLATARRVTVLTGAGVSAASGVPTFRGHDGLWRRYRAQDLATPEAFAHDPVLVWQWYDWRRQTIARAHPNRAHEVLALWSERHDGFTLITQNVDGLHERAETRNVVRFHGSIWDLRCWEDCGGEPRVWTDLAAPLPVLPPRCPHCGGLARPDVVWFGEAIPRDAAERAYAAVACDLFLSIGTSAIVFPAAGLAAHASRHHALTVEINLEASAIAGGLDLAIEGPAAEVLDAIETARAALSPEP